MILSACDSEQPAVRPGVELMGPAAALAATGQLDERTATHRRVACFGAG